MKEKETHLLDLSGNKVHTVLHKGTCEHQNDALAITSMPGCEALDFTSSLPRALEKANDSIIQRHKDLMKSGMESDDAHKTVNNCTATLVGYKPKYFTLDVVSYDDSPAFLILDDGQKVRAVTVTPPAAHKIKGLRLEGEKDDMLLICRLAGVTICTENKIGRTYYEFDTIVDQLPEGPLRDELEKLKEEKFMRRASHDIHTLVEKAVQQYGMNEDALKLSLVVTSDGILSGQTEPGRITPSFDMVTGQFVDSHGNPVANSPERIAERRIADLYERAKGAGNIAETMVDIAMEGGAYDNMSVAVMEDLKPGKGQPLVASVFDAPGKEPAKSKTIAVNTVTETLEGHCKKLHTRKITGRNTASSQSGAAL